jgi:chlorite dismutase
MDGPEDKRTREATRAMESIMATAKQPDDRKAQTIRDMAESRPVDRTASSRMLDTNRTLTKQIEAQKTELVKDMMVVPAYKDFKPDGTFWVASSSPMDFVSATEWLRKRVVDQQSSTKSWIGFPEVKIVKSRGLIDSLLKHPSLPEGCLFN